MTIAGIRYCVLFEDTVDLVIDGGNRVVRGRIASVVPV